MNRRAKAYSPAKLKVVFCLTLLLVEAGVSVFAGGQAQTKPPRSQSSTAPAVSQSDLNSLKVMNYYPSASSWKNMWTQWNPSVIDSDFALIASLHANTVRVIVNVSAFGYPASSSTMLDELSQIITLADKHGLKTQLTLFDWWSSYTDIAGSKTWVSQLLASYVSDPRIAFIELQNEIKPEDSAAMSWAQVLLPYVKAAAGNIPVTVSVTNGSSGGPSAELPLLISALGASQPDFYDIHQYYGAAYEDYYQLRQAQQVANAQGLPLFVGETGASTNAVDYTNLHIPKTQASYEAYQDFVYRSAFYATSDLGLPVAAPWILWDFVPGSLTWLSPDSDQYNYGLYRADGSAKPAAATVSTFFSTGSVDTSFNNGFESWISGSPNLPTLWQIYRPDLGNFATDTSVAHSGSASVKIWNSSYSSSGQPSFFAYPIAGIMPGTSYTASVYVKGQNATGTTQICLSWFTSSFSYLGNACGGSLFGTTAWQKISTSGIAPTGVAYVELFLSSANNNGTAWFDDASFQ